MSMEKEFVPDEPASELKELGFNEPCFGLYAPPCKTVFLHHYGLLSAKEQILAPTFSQAFRWFRKKYNLDSSILPLYKSTIKVGYYFGIDEYKGIEFQMDLDDYYKTYEEAELACLIKLIEIVKSK